jgi:hypothetical protein
MRYETPECVLIGEASTVILGGDPAPAEENFVSTPRPELVGYDE